MGRKGVFICKFKRNLEKLITWAETFKLIWLFPCCLYSKYYWLDCTKCVWLIEWWMLGGHLGTGCLLCVMKSSHTFRLTFFQLCTDVMDTLMMCMRLFGSVQIFFEKWSCHFSSRYWINSTCFMQSIPLTPLGWHSSTSAQLLWTH
jgi:hypothetical protein